jgi:hypothetical protein
MGTSRTSRDVLTSTNKRLETALVKYLPKGSFSLDGQTWKTSDVVAALQKEDTLIAAALAARGASQAAASAARAQTAANDDLRLQLKGAVIAALGSRSGALQEFGISVRPRARRTGATIAGAAQKAKATREARGTLGRKQRLAIRGGVATSPVTSSTAAVTPGAVPTAPGVTTK